MKYLTGPYLALMTAFKDRSEDVLSKQEYEPYRIANMQEYCTLRLDGGRQSGKTEALSLFARDWIEDGGQIIVLSDTLSFAETTRSRILKQCSNLVYNKYDQIKTKVFTQSIRSYLSNNGRDRWRGVSLGKVLVVIDEPCHRMPEIYKFYKAFDDNLRISTLTSGEQLPLFFVLGVQ